MGEVFGGTVTLAPHLVHGKADDIKLDRSCPLFKNLPPVIKGARYHSLIVERDSLPPELLVTAETYAGEIMGLRHRDYEIYGLQFHPRIHIDAHGRQHHRKFSAPCRCAFLRRLYYD